MWKTSIAVLPCGTYTHEKSEQRKTGDILQGGTKGRGKKKGGIKLKKNQPKTKRKIEICTETHCEIHMREVVLN